MQDMPPTAMERIKTRVRTSLTVKLLTIGFLMLLLLIPLSMVESLIYERMNRSDEAIEEVSNDWGGRQLLSGPVLTVPMEEAYEVKTGKVTETHYRTRYLQLFPERSEIAGNLQPEKLNRGIYNVVVYKGDLQQSGHFDLARIKDRYPNRKIDWSQAVINLHLSDLRGIREELALQSGGKSLPFVPGLNHCPNLPSGVHAPLPLTGAEGQVPFSMNLSLRGSSEIEFTPLAKVTDVQLTSTWPHPKFSGAFLPEDRQVSANGFTARWKVLDLNRPLPQLIEDEDQSLNTSRFGAELLMPTTQYRMTERTAKYGAMVIGLTFLILFFTQVMQKLNVHPFQYILIGLALVLFYTLLLSFSEFISFHLAYVLASLMVIGLLTAYLHAIIKNGRATGILLGLEVIIFGFIFVVISLEDTALLVGSIGLFLALAAVMLASRKIDWYNLKGEDPQP